MLKFSILVDPGTGVDGTWWNAMVMGNLAAKMGEGFFTKKRYAKFIGLGQANKEWTSAKTGKSGKSNEILVTAIELQDGTYVKPDSDKEDAPF